MAPAADTVVTLPDDLRGAFKDPLGPLYTDAEALLADAGAPLVAVGDIVTYHLERAGRPPDVAVVDGRTKREAVDDHVRETIGDGDRREDVVNPAGTLSATLLDALVRAIDRPDATVVDVDGEEDLAALPAIVAAPDGASVVYGQPDEGVVHVRVDDETRSMARDLLSRMDGDHDRLWSILDS